MVVQRKSVEPFLKDEVDFYQHQADGIRRMWNMQSFLLADDMGLGKAQVLNEPVLTPNGFTTMGKLSVGDEVVSVEGTPTKVTGVFPQGIRTMALVTFSDKSSVSCDLDHLWEVNSPVRKRRGNPGLVKTARELMAGGLKDAAGNRKWYIPMVAPVQFDQDYDLPVDPYTLGVLLGDGSMSQHYVGIDTDLAVIKSLILPDGVSVTSLSSTDHKYSQHAHLSGMVPYMKELGLMGTLSNSKFIPTDYLHANVENRIALLQGLIDTDGTVVASRGNVATTIEYGTVSQQLAEGVKFIVQSLGGTVSIQEKVPTYSYKGLEGLEGQLFYRMVLHVPSGITPFRLQRKLDKWTPRSKYEPSRGIESIEVIGEEEAVCISVDHPRHLYVTKDFIVTHNTLQVLAVFSINCKKMWSKYQVHQKMLVVCPVSLKDNWLDEIENFTRIKAMKLDGSPAMRKQQIADFEKLAENESAILIVNYEQVSGHLAQLNAIGFDCIAADEAHYLKNPKSKRTKSFQALRSSRNFLMTGTPLMNNVNELWVLLDRIQPGQWGTYWGFTQEFCAFGGYMGKQITGPKNEQKLRNDMANIMIRRTKEEVLDLPEVQYINRLVHLTPLQRKLYDRVAKEFLLDRGAGVDSEEAIENPMTKFLRLKQICGTTASILDTKEDSSAKLDLAIEDAQEITAKNEKIVVFSQFRSVVACYAERARKEMPNVPVFELHGDVPINERQAMVKEWGGTKGAAIIVCIIKVAGVGLNMTQAKYGQFIDKDFTPGNNKQAVDRMHRIGADKTQAVQIFEYRAKDTAESRVEVILKVKKNIFEAVVEQKKLQDAIMDALKEDMARVRS